MSPLGEGGKLDVMNLAAARVHEQHAIDVVGRRVLQELPSSRRARRGGRLVTRFGVGDKASTPPLQEKVRAKMGRDRLAIDEDGERTRRLGLDDAVARSDEELLCAIFASLSETPSSRGVPFAPPTPHREGHAQHEQKPDRGHRQSLIGPGRHAPSQCIASRRSTKPPKRAAREAL